MNLKAQWQLAANDEAKLAFLSQFAEVGHPLDHGMLGCDLEALDVLAEKAGFSLIWIRGGNHGLPGHPDGVWRRAACVSAKFAHLHPARSGSIERVAGWADD